MKLWLSLALAGSLAGATSLGAQTVVVPDPKLNPQQEALRDVLYAFRDSVGLVGAAVARLGRDFQTASDQSLQSRALVLSRACRVSAGMAPGTRDSVANLALPASDPHNARLTFLKSLDSARAELDRCGKEFGELADQAHREKAKELRAYGRGRAERVLASVNHLEASLKGYFRLGVGVAYRPNTKGAGEVAH